jgi:hypothetical protein
MARRPEPSEYEKFVGGLEGDAFQDEVCTRLQGHISDFQRIPDKPSGDGGLDGLSHGQESGYCCYGPEQNPVKVKLKGLKDDIVEKFSADLRRLFELAIGENRRVKHSPNAELATIMAEGTRIKNVYLVVSWFETHRIIGPLNTTFKRYVKGSELKFVHPDATLTIWGPKDLAARGPLDEHTLFRLQNRQLFDRIRNASPEAIPPDTVGDFDAKFDDLKRRRPARTTHVDELANDFRRAWAAAITLDNDLASTSIILHEALETARTDAAQAARLRSLSDAEPHQLIEQMRQDVVQRLEQGLGQRLGGMTARIADGVVAGLIGECPVEWRDEDA